MKLRYAALVSLLFVSCSKSSNSSGKEFYELAEKNFIVERLSTQSGVDLGEAEYVITYKADGPLNGIRITTINPGWKFVGLPSGPLELLKICENLNYGGLRGWELPDVETMVSLSSSGLSLVGSGNQPLFPNRQYRIPSNSFVVKDLGSRSSNYNRDARVIWNQALLISPFWNGERAITEERDESISRGRVSSESLSKEEESKILSNLTWGASTYICVKK